MKATAYAGVVDPWPGSHHCDDAWVFATVTSVPLGRSLHIPSNRGRETVILDLVAWYVTRHPDLPDTVLASDFEYLWGFETLDRETFVLRCTNGEPWEVWNVVALLVDSERAVIVFEGLDPVTNLRHRMGWLLEHANGQVTKILEVDTIIDESRAPF